MLIEYHYPDPKGLFMQSDDGCLIWINVPFCASLIEGKQGQSTQHLIEDVGKNEANQIVFFVNGTAYLADLFVIDFSIV